MTTNPSQNPAQHPAPNPAPEDQYIVEKVRGRDARPPLVLAALMCVIGAFQLNATMLSPAIGDMADRLHTNAGVIGWSSTVFLAVSAALAILLPPYADKIGRRRALISSVAMMILGTVIALVAPNTLWLMIGRGLQGFCGATFSLGNLTLRAILEPRKFGAYMGLVAAINSGVAGIDTLAGGMITDAFGYRGIFGVILLVEVAAVILVFRWVPETRVAAAASMDWPGALSMTGALWALNMVLTLGFSETGWTSPWTVGLFGAAVVLAICFVVRERRTPQPLIPLSVLAQRQIWGLLGTTFFTLASAFSVLLFALPALSQDPAGFGMGGTVSALMFLTPFSLLGWLLAPAAGWLAPRVGYRLVLRFGLAGTLLLSVGMVAGLGSKWALFALSLLMGATYSAATNTALNALGVLYAPPERPGVLPGLNDAAYNIGAGIGMGVMASVVASAVANGDATGGYRTALVIGAIASAAALGFSFALPGRATADEKV
ncbi:MAG: MFS transporter [Bifidobacteriaceae bacterium]|jgi:predicted MFS family arabinose efflux permease|nr:MFS transporter [Bifidobacteriaceae bacterium]